MTDTVEKFSISLYPSVVESINQCEGKRSSVINKSLERYFAALAKERKALRRLFSKDEISLVVNVANETIFDSISIPMLRHDVQDGIELDHLDKKWGINGNALINKLDQLSYTQILAFVDATERYWYRIGEGESIDPGECLN